MLKRILLLTACAILTLSSPAEHWVSARPLLPAPEQPLAQDAGSERQRGLELIRQNKAAEARPLLERAAQANPNDVEVQISTTTTVSSHPLAHFRHRGGLSESSKAAVL